MITLKFSEEARRHAFRGMTKLTEAVRQSMGPGGRNLALENADYNTKITKDGASIVRAITGGELMDRYENLGCMFIKDASYRTEDMAGDGTSQSLLLTYEMINGGLRYMERGVNAIKIRNGMKKAVDAAIKSIEEQSREAKTKAAWRQVAYVSSQDEEIADMVADAMDSVKGDGLVIVQEGDEWEEHEMKLEYVNGMKFPRGFFEAWCINDQEKNRCYMENVAIIVMDYVLSTPEHMEYLKQTLDGYIQKTGKKDIVLFAQDFQGPVKIYLAKNNMLMTQSQGAQGMRILAIRSPGYGRSYTEEFGGDISVFTGANFISESRGTRIEELTLDCLGHVDSIETTDRETRIVNRNANKEIIASRVSEIESGLKTTNSELAKKRYKERKAALTTGFSIITVGGYVYKAIQEKKDRVDDAVLASKSAFEEGIVAGGGVAYLQCQRDLESVVSSDRDETLGIEIVKKALESPCAQIASNSGQCGEAIVRDVKRINGENMILGYDASGDYTKEVDMFEQGIVDAAKVCKASLRNALDSASLFLTTECMVVNVKEDLQHKPIFELIED